MNKKKINIGLVGLGNIGANFYNYIKNNSKKIHELTGKTPYIKYISAKNFKKKRSFKFNKKQWIKNPIEIVEKDVDIIVELVGGSGNLPKKLITQALKNKKHVITANKTLIAKHGDVLSSIAETNAVNLEFEAAVAGGVPIIRSLKDSLLGNKIYSIIGILNGTSNFILTQMEKKQESFKQILKEAQLKGYAETNPSADLNGEDVMSKIKILSALAFKKKISQKKILMEGIENIDLEDIQNVLKMGFKVKLIGKSILKNGKLLEFVYPALIPKNNYLANINGVLNAVILSGHPVGQSVYQGEGAGPEPTVSSIISDLCSILRGNIKYPFGVSSKLRKITRSLNYNNYKTSAYIKIDVIDKYGVLSSITNSLAKNKISIKRVIQNPNKKNKTATIIIITHKSLEKNYTKCLKFLKKSQFVLKKPVFMRIESI